MKHIMKILRKPMQWGTCEVYNGPKWDARLVNLREVLHHRSQAGVTKHDQMLVFRRYELGRRESVSFEVRMQSFSQGPGLLSNMLFGPILNNVSLQQATFKMLYSQFEVVITIDFFWGSAFLWYACDHVLYKKHAPQLYYIVHCFKDCNQVAQYQHFAQMRSTVYCNSYVHISFTVHMNCGGTAVPK